MFYILSNYELNDSMLNDDVLNLFVKYCYKAKFNNDLCIKG